MGNNESDRMSPEVVSGHSLNLLWMWADSLLPPVAVFAHCNVCGIRLRTPEEDQMGMCERCAAE